MLIRNLILSLFFIPIIELLTVFILRILSKLLLMENCTSLNIDSVATNVGALNWMFILEGRINKLPALLHVFV